MGRAAGVAPVALDARGAARALALTRAPPPDAGRLLLHFPCDTHAETQAVWKALQAAHGSKERMTILRKPPGTPLASKEWQQPHDPSIPPPSFDAKPRQSILDSWLRGSRGA